MLLNARTYDAAESVVLLAPARPRWLGSAASSVKLGQLSKRASCGLRG
jgi:hypothetical protein